ncbi:hypothetical protein B4U79_19179 [Dinothrombium tinctorium]|uniref:F-box domain-containing protein n=1 Tax=Dinothrombium tinctorium TaxID=1965070 RepID=A0A3S3RJ89_9ACAR|nr:hypothetical protein B4U79_19180 [Dinothrombium tinctorium]RWS00498.1 hypothetical protein B4U79_19179 [Dinothrombium tinctorium]
MASEYCLTDLPEDVLFKIISFASFEDIRALCLVSKRMNEICKRQMRSRQILLNRPKPNWGFASALLQDMESIYANGTCFKHLPNLDRLYISEYWKPDFTNFPYERLQSCLKQLYLNCCYSYFGKTLSKLKSLQTVAFDFSGVLSNKGMPQIFTQVSRHARIENLCIRVSKQIECNIDSLANCENIKSLTIVSTRYSTEYCVSDDQLKKLIARFPNLECLRLMFELSTHYAFDLIDFCEAREFPQTVKEIKQLKFLRCFDLVLLREVCGSDCEEDHESDESDKKPPNSDKNGIKYAFSLFDCENISKFRFGFFDSTTHFSDYCQTNEIDVKYLDTPVQIFNSTNKLWKDFGSNVLGFHQKYHDLIANYYSFDPEVLQANLDYMKNLTTE